MRIVSIDPGLSGALVFWRDGKPDYFEKMPTVGKEVDLAALKHMLEDVEMVILEKVGGIMAQSASASFNFGKQVGMIIGMALSMGVRVEEVAPQKWQAVAHRGLPKAMPPKERSRAAAIRLFPNFNTIPEGCRISNDGVCDALLIGHWYHEGEKK